jgi:hypothetical protein
MGAHIEQHDVPIFYAQNQYDTIGVGQTYRMLVPVPPLQRMQAQFGSLGILFKLLQDILE